MNKGDYDLKLKAIDLLKKSESFPKKEFYFQILKYLIEEEKKGKNVKSLTIAIDLLNAKDHKGGKIQDSYIRSKVFSLRKDLDIFYLSEGMNFPLKIGIPKGKYKVNLISNNTKTLVQIKSKIKRNNRLLKLSSIFSILLLLTTIYLCILLKTKHTNLDNKPSLVSLFLSLIHI